MVTTPNAGASDLIRHGENGWLVPPRDSEALAGRMEWCIDHHDVLADMRDSALATARRWTWAEFRRAFRVKLVEHLEVLGAFHDSAHADCHHS